MLNGLGQRTHLGAKRSDQAILIVALSAMLCNQNASPWLCVRRMVVWRNSSRLRRAAAVRVALRTTGMCASVRWARGWGCIPNLIVVAIRLAVAKAITVVVAAAATTVPIGLRLSPVRVLGLVLVREQAGMPQRCLVGAQPGKQGRIRVRQSMLTPWGRRSVPVATLKAGTHARHTRLLLVALDLALYTCGARVRLQRRRSLAVRGAGA